MNIIRNMKTIYERLTPKFKFIAWVFMALVLTAVVFAIPAIGMVSAGAHPTKTTDLSNDPWFIVFSGLYLSVGFATIISLSIYDHLQDQYRNRLQTISK